MRRFIVLLIIGLFIIVSSQSFAGSDTPSADDSKHKWTDQEKFGTELPIPGYREGMADMVSEGTLKKYSTSKYPDWYRASYYYKAAIGPPTWVATGLEQRCFVMSHKKSI